MSSPKNDWVGLALSNGRYRVGRKLGEGGMGFVYQVHDANIDADVVIKVPRRSMLDDPEFAPRFAREIRSLVKLAHPNIVRVSDVGEHDGLPFAVMQYLSGGSLEDRRPGGSDGRAAPAPLRSVLGWLPPIAAALDFMHAQGYVHRDVKPGNILFDEHGHAFLSDFGVAKALSASAATAGARSTVTGAGLVLGTPEYMAPELIMGRPFDGRADQYALATTVYELLCGRRPFDAETGTAVLVLQANSPPPPPEEILKRGAGPAAEVVLKGLSKRPEDRFKTCAEFASALERAILACPEDEPRVAAAGKFDCPACSKPLKMPKKVLDNLAGYQGRTCACPSCGSTLRMENGGFRIVAGAVERSPAEETGTRLFSVASTPSEEYPLTSPTDGPPSRPARTVPAAPPPQGDRPRTVVERAPVDSPRPERARTVVERAPVEPISPGRAAKTVIERTPDVPTFPIGAAPKHLVETPASSKPPIWIGIAAVAVVAVGVSVYVAVSGGNKKSSTDVARIPPPTIIDERPNTDGPRPSDNPAAPSRPALDLANLAGGATTAPPISPAPPRAVVPVATGNPGFELMASKTDAGSRSNPDPAKAPLVPAPRGKTANRPAPAASDAAPSAANSGFAAKPKVEMVKGPPVELETILKRPESYVGLEIVPKGFHYVSNEMGDGDDGLKRPTVVSKGGSYRQVRRFPGDKQFPSAPEIVMEEDLADRIRSNIGRGKPLLPPSQVEDGYPVILTVHVLRSDAPGEPKHLVKIVKIKYLIDIDEASIARKSLKDSFKNLVVTAESAVTEIGESEEWRVRFAKRINAIQDIAANQRRQGQNRLSNQILQGFHQAGAAGANAAARGQADFIRSIRGY